MLPVHADTSHVIQLAVAPSFMLAAIGATLTLLMNRLARINDRTHKRREDQETATPEVSRTIVDELADLNRRAKILNAASTVAASSAILVCLLIGLLFLANELGGGLDRAVELLFALAMVGLIVTYLLLLVEIFVAQKSINPT